MATIEGYKARAALLRLLMNYYTRESGNTHAHALHKTQKEKKRKKSCRKRKIAKES